MRLRRSNRRHVMVVAATVVLGVAVFGCPIDARSRRRFMRPFGIVVVAMVVAPVGLRIGIALADQPRQLREGIACRLTRVRPVRADRGRGHIGNYHQPSD